MPCVNTRAFFSKKGRAKYISAIDLNNCVLRAVRRSRLPVWKTEGFNPHTYVAFVLPLSLGQEGEREAMDFRLLEDIPYDVVAERLNNALPPDIRVSGVAAPIHKNSDIGSAEYRIETGIDEVKLAEFLAREEILVEKRTKKGVTAVDLKPLIYKAEFFEGGLSVRLPAGNELNINPTLLMDAYWKYSEI
ncbi:MAG: TIGR03936 family radical SAM-associated protein, partial [Oscillospiraceae bacterium]|nr:TIGR03936 family radical SAM-associated protein [Oscillospiraceae bacterium]